MTHTNRLYATDLPEAQWYKSTYSDGGEQCVEVADARHTHGLIAVRDSKDKSGPILGISPTEFVAFTHFARSLKG
ncbi:DUF397 domain-containing protein [Streptomyces sp. NPDC048717]|uniref:DUF397 domain-containing protein n=1 Tax=Streptomyces sp. NPDC048717 TaxID=3154928 RepID=UPI003435BCAC